MTIEHGQPRTQQARKPATPGQVPFANRRLRFGPVESQRSDRPASCPESPDDVPAKHLFRLALII